MKKLTRFVGLDVHAATFSVAIADENGSVVSVGRYPNEPNSVRKVIRKLGKQHDLSVAYEAGPCGYTIYRQLDAMKVRCIVVAPTLIPIASGDRVKTDRRDAEKLARLLRSGDLVPVWVPDEDREALRDLVRARLAAKKDQLQARNRLGKFLLRLGLKPAEKLTRWSAKYLLWLRQLELQRAAQQLVLVELIHEFDHVGERIKRLEAGLDDAIGAAPEETQVVISALQSLRGVAQLTAVTLVAEVGQFSRFSSAAQLMSYGGIVPREHSSGGRVRRGAITKAGNAHVRRVMVESAWNSRFRPAVSPRLKKRQEGLSPDIIAHAWKAQHRLHNKYKRLLERSKNKQQTVTAVARELLGFVWAIAVRVETGGRLT